MTKPRFIWLLVFLLFILHQDCWFWNDSTLVFGVVPIGLFYHVTFSLVTGAVWALAWNWAWPHRIEEWADEIQDQQPPSRNGGGI